LFAEKIKTADMSVLFPDYDGGHDYDAGVGTPAFRVDVFSHHQIAEYLKQKFAAQNHTEEVRVFTHVTCATDEKNVQFTFDAVKAIVLDGSLAASGLT
jgi:guanine nucleotide-binding protein subunit alpha